MTQSPFQTPNQPIESPQSVKQHYQQNVQQVQNIPQIPAESIALPSKGLVYPLGHPLSNENSIEIKALDAYGEDILTSKALIKNGTVISQLLRYCILNKTIEPEDMLTGDRNAVLVGVRVTRIWHGICGKDFLSCL
jgi:hypothetical protein